MSFPHPFVTIATLVCSSAALAQTGGAEHYYLTLFGGQSVPYRTRYTHTWATFIKVSPAADGSLAVQAETISWMPATLRIRPLALRPEPGVNLTLGQTFAWAGSVNGRVSVAGPFEIDSDRYARLVVRKGELESGATAYRAIGGLTRDSAVSNCGQSFPRASPVVGRRFLEPTPQPGEHGMTRLAARYVRAGAFVDPSVTHDWLLPVVGVPHGSVVHRRPGEWVGHSPR